ncbi:MAG: insulinase family protein [Deltaproteobacteria bacterium]|nr:insulinase family protein [Deltaproteobacteria bacterium]
MTTKRPQGAPRRSLAARQRARSAMLAEQSGTNAIAYEGALPFGSALSVERYRLANGLQVLLVEDRAAPVVAYHTWFRVGSRHERQGKTGLAHLLEHLMFNEFEGMKPGEFDRKLEEAGAETNAATWVDWTYYYENLPASQLGLAIALESRRMGKLVMQQAQVTSELEVVANERRYRVDDDVDGAVSEKLYSRAFTTHGYRTPTIGWMDDIKGLTPDDCRGFYTTYYAPNNATLVVVGDFDEVATIRKIAAAYGELKPAEIPVEDSHPDAPQTEQRTEVLHKPTPTDKVSIGYHGPALADYDHSALSLLNDILFGGRSSRVHRALVQDAEIATDVRGWVSTFQDPGLYEIGLVARPERSAEELLAKLDEQLEKVCAEPVTEDELERARARAELGLLRGMETCGGKAEQIAFYTTTLGEPCGAFQRLEQLRRVTRSDVLKAARRYLRPEARTVITVHPQPKEATP